MHVSSIVSLRDSSVITINNICLDRSTIVPLRDCSVIAINIWMDKRSTSINNPCMRPCYAHYLRKRNYRNTHPKNCQHYCNDRKRYGRGRHSQRNTCLRSYSWTAAEYRRRPACRGYPTLTCSYRPCSRRNTHLRNRCNRRNRCTTPREHRLRQKECCWNNLGSHLGSRDLRRRLLEQQSQE